MELDPVWASQSPGACSFLLLGCCLLAGPRVEEHYEGGWTSCSFCPPRPLLICRCWEISVCDEGGHWLQVSGKLWLESA